MSVVHHYYLGIKREVAKEVSETDSSQPGEGNGKTQKSDTVRNGERILSPASQDHG